MNSLATAIEAEFRSRPGVRIKQLSTYFKVIGPSASVHRPASWYVAVEHFNGAVILAQPIAIHMGASLRPHLPIRQDPLGHSHRGNYGRFTHGLAPSNIQNRPPLGVTTLVDDVIAAFAAAGISW